MQMAKKEKVKAARTEFEKYIEDSVQVPDFQNVAFDFAAGYASDLIGSRERYVSEYQDGVIALAKLAMKEDASSVKKLAKDIKAKYTAQYFADLKANIYSKAEEEYKALIESKLDGIDPIELINALGPNPTQEQINIELEKYVSASEKKDIENKLINSEKDKLKNEFTEIVKNAGIKASEADIKAALKKSTAVISM